MKVKYAGIWLAPGGVECASGVSLNGSQVVELQQLFRATAIRPVARGNKQDVFSFAVRQAKDTVRLAERAMLSILATLPGSGQLEVTCGQTGDEETFYLDAVLQSVERTSIGLSPAYRYTFVGGLFTTDGTSLPSIFDEIDGGAANSTYEGAGVEG